MPLTSCSSGVGNYIQADCNTPDPLDGGIDRLVVAVNDIDTTDITDLTNATQWNTAITNGNVEITSSLLGDIPEPANKTAKTTSCSPEQVVNKTRTLNLKDYNTSNDNRTFWQNAEDNSIGLKFGYIDCNNNFYGWIDSSVLTASLIWEEDSQEGNNFWQAVLQWTLKAELASTVFPAGVL